MEVGQLMIQIVEEMERETEEIDNLLSQILLEIKKFLDDF